MKVLTSLTYVAFRAGERLACVLPPRAVPWVARVGGAVAVAVMPGRRRMVARHLRRVHAAQFGQGDQGHLEGRALSRSVRATFRSYASYWLDTFRMCRLDPVALDATVEGRGLELVDRALQNGRGAVLATAHLGSWDLGGAWLAGRGYPLTAVVERLRPPRLLNWFVDVRRRLGMEVIVRGPDVWERLEQALQSNHLVVLVSDRDLGGRGVAVRFFGEETTLPRRARPVGSPVRFPPSPRRRVRTGRRASSRRGATPGGGGMQRR